MKNRKILIAAAALLFPLCAGAQYSNPPGNTRVGTESADDEAPAARPQVRKKKSSAAVPLPAGDQPERAQATGAAGEDLSNPGGNRFEALMIKSRVGAALGSLASVRTSLQIYYGDTEGNFPPDLQTLVPKWADSIPEIEVPGYAKTNKVTIIKVMKTMTLRKVIKNTGGWLYIADPKSKRWGDVVIDSVKIYKGKPLYEQ
jgi:hypothetical protein